MKYICEFLNLFFINLSNSIVLLVLKYLSKLLILILLFFLTNFFESKIRSLRVSRGLFLSGFLFVIAQKRWF